MRLWSRQLGLLTVLGALLGCQTTGLPPGDSARPKAKLAPLVILPVQFPDDQPDSFCHADIGDDLRGALARRLRRAGGRVTLPGTSIPPTFAPAPPPPEPGERPFLLRHYADSAETALLLWVEEYLAPGLCEGLGGGQTLKMGVMAVLYDLPAGTELGRWSVKEWVSGTDDSRHRVWRVTERLAADLHVRLLPRLRQLQGDAAGATR